MAVLAHQMADIGNCCHLLGKAGVASAIPCLGAPVCPGWDDDNHHLSSRVVGETP